MSFYTFNDGSDLAISMFILNSISIFVKLIQEYRGGGYIYSGGKGLNHQRPNMALTTLESFFYIL